MADFTLKEFREIVAQCFENSEADELDQAALGTEFSDLGYDSLVVYEIAMRIKDDYGVPIPDEALDELRTPGALIDYVASFVPVTP